MAPDTAVAVIPRSKFAEVMAAIGDGTLEADISDAIVELVETLRQLGEGGGKPKAAITLKIKFMNDRGMFDVDSEMSVTAPKKVRPRTVMWPIVGGGLSRTNQHQLDAFHKDPPPDSRPALDISISR